jgi:acyl dehydratase
MEYKPRGKTFDDLNIGDEVVTIGRTITETDVVNFAGISGDFQPEHIHEEYGRKSQFRGRIAHGLLVTAISTGMVNQTGITEGTTIATMEMKQRFLKPVRFGDTIQAIFKIVDKRETKKADRGIVFAGLTVINQIDEIVLEGEIVILLYRKGYPREEKGKLS